MELIQIALLMGFISGFHCLGMCGPIAFSLGLSAKNKFKFYFQNIIYQLGRVTTYGIMGAFLGIFGQGINFSGYQNVLSITIGVLLLLLVIVPKSTSFFNGKFQFLDRFFIQLKIKLGIFIQRKDTPSKYITGILNGFIPCGAVYLALTASMAQGNIVNGMLFMIYFGLGTIPMMFISVVFGNVLGLGLKNKLFKLYPYLMFLFGILFILRGLELGIPHISPNPEALQVHPKHSCCH